MRVDGETGNETVRRFGRSALVLALVAMLALLVGGCCLDDGSGCDSDGECCSDYCDPDYLECVSLEARAAAATRKASRTVAQRTQPKKVQLGFECLKRKIAR